MAKQFKSSNSSSNLKDNCDPASAQAAADLLVEEALKLDIPVEQRQEKHVNGEQFNDIVNAIAKDFGVEPPIALAGLACTLQAGGTSNNKRSNVKITVSQVAFESKKVNAIIIKTGKVTPRQFAKQFASQIQRLAVKHKVIGNSYVYLKRFYSNIITESNAFAEEPYWCADFQIDNQQCPEYIREALRLRFSDKFRKKKAT